MNYNIFYDIFRPRSRIGFALRFFVRVIDKKSILTTRDPTVATLGSPTGFDCVRKRTPLKMTRVVEIGTIFLKKIKKLNDTLRKSRQWRTVPEGTVRALSVVIIPVKSHYKHILLGCIFLYVSKLNFHTLPKCFYKTIIRRCMWT